MTENLMKPRLSWDHLRLILNVKGEVRKNYYFTMAIKNHWSVSELKEKIQNFDYEDTTLFWSEK